VAPNDVKRYFVTPQESGELCLMSCIFGENRDVFFPKLSADLHLITFAEIAVKYLAELGYEAYECSSEEEARELVKTLPDSRKWPCYFSSSDTTGEKDFEEFFTAQEKVDTSTFQNIGVIKNELQYNESLFDHFENSISEMKSLKSWNKEQLVDLFHYMIPDFNHKETGKYLDSKM
jgi:FlaA1/EpsC-like NDP-sugar epimerase